MKAGKSMVTLLILALILGVIWPAGSAMVSAKESEVRADEDAPYTVEFTYDDREFVMGGNSSVSLKEILNFLGFEGEIDAVSVSNEKLFSAEKKDGEWMVTAHKVFITTEWMKVTIGGETHEITVTDDVKYYNPITQKMESKSSANYKNVQNPSIWMNLGGKEDRHMWTTDMDGIAWYSWYVVSEDFTLSKRVKVIGEDINLILCDGVTLTCENGIDVPEGSKLTIWAQSTGSNMGKLVTNAKNPQSPLGTGNDAKSGTIIINGGDITATTNGEAAAIGGGSGESATSITINGGNIKATSNEGAAIGSGKGQGTNGGSITINGGNVSAISTIGAGIGGGNGGNGGVTIINGGVVYAESLVRSAGIGGGEDGKCGKIIINDGNVTAFGNGGAAIGSGVDGTAVDVTINGGTIVARAKTSESNAGVDGKSSGAGIGSGMATSGRSDSGIITINGGNVTVEGGWTSAGIGGANHGDGGNIFINGGTIDVIGGEYGAAIGGGYDGAPGNITITGGNVTARSFISKSKEPKTGAAIGSGYGGASGSINISGGVVNAIGSRGSAGIGGAYGSAECTINVSGGQITATGGENAAGIGGGADGEEAVITLSYSNATRDTMSINASSYYGRVTVLENCLFNDGFGNVYTGELTGTQLNKIVGKTLRFDIKVSYLGEDGKVCDPVTGVEVTGSAKTWNGTNGKDGWYIVSGTVTISDLITVTGDVKLILCDSAKLTATKGINVTQGNSLTIYAQSTENKKGKLIATGSAEQAGIGSGIQYDGNNKRLTLPGGTIKIYGGEVEATGGQYAAGIGGGWYCRGGNIVLGGGTISATGGEDAAGIGGGFKGRAGKIHVTGTAVLKKVTAGEGKGNCDIGVGGQGFFTAYDGDDITIDGGTIQGVSKIGGESCNIVLDHNASKAYLPSIKADAYVGNVTLKETFVDKTATGGKKVFVPGNAKNNNTLIEQMKDTTLEPGRGYAITMGSGINNGVVEAKNLYQAAQQGDKVTLTAVPAQDFVLQEITVKGIDGRNVSIKRNDNEITFTMPNCAVTVWAKFKAANAISYIDPTKTGNDRIQYQDEYTMLTDQMELESGWYAVRGDVLIGSQIVKRIVVKGNVNLILCDGATLNSLRGITVEKGNSLTIWAQSEGENAGTLKAGGVSDSGSYLEHGVAGLGGLKTGEVGDITINGGNVIATGGASGAGIGSGFWYAKGGTVTINGGNVTAIGGENAAGIGIGSGHSSGGKVLINGGVVNATGGTDKESGESGAGIGSGCDSEGIEVIIMGGKVNAVGGTGSAGIGPGMNGTETSVTIGSNAQTAENMSVKANSYGGTVKLLCGFKDAIDGTLFEKTEDANKSELAGRTLIPTDFYHVNVADGIQNGSVTAPTVAEKGTTVTITAEAEEHYELKSLTVTAGTTTVDLAKVDENTYTFSMPEGDATVSAEFQKKKYVIKFLNEDGSELQSSEVAYGEMPVYAGKEPEKEATQQYSYQFKAWDAELAAVVGEATYTATYEDILNKYEIQFVDENGKVLQSSEVEYGEMPEFTGTIPDKAETDQYTYEFNGWDKAIEAVTGKATYKTTYKEILRKYVITFVNDDGSKLYSSEVAYGEIPPYASVTPIKGSTDENMYPFKGWSPAVTAVTGEATYSATYDTVKRKYYITFVNEDGTVLQSTEVTYGEVPVYAGEEPVKKATAQNSYVFQGWDKNITAVTGMATYKATFGELTNSYKITWLMDDGSLIDETTVEFGKVPTHADATKKATAEFTYTFTGWDKAPAAVTGEATYKATFTNGTNSYKITWLMDDGSLIDETTVEFGKVPTHADATKKATDEFTYTFTGWDVTPVAVTGEATYKATFKENKKDSGGSTTVVTNEYGDYLDELRERLRYAIALGGEQSVYWNKGTSLPKDILKTLEDHPDITLVFDYVYENEKYSVTMPGKIVKTVEGVEWYGPVYLYCTYGKAEAEVATSEISGIYVVKSGDTLSRIARKLHVKQKYLVDVNKIKNPDFIRAGQVLKY